ncbi:hypothetical protein KEJ51_01235 [Candidatus Bathyarchaeota archaeon]|nr:hypothetical protein [Candidatus Bathyarchaeota archaeon]MBS7628461.1 hypothetical protein [Candidatus Bathyarchaeota archaeon]
MKVKPYAVETLTDYLQELRRALSERRPITSLRVDFKSMVDTVDRLDEMLSSPSLSKLEREGITLIREYIKEASMKSYSGRGEEAVPYVDRALEAALTLNNLNLLKEGGVALIHPDELVEMDRVGGRPVYSIKRR